MRVESRRHNNLIKNKIKNNFKKILILKDKIKKNKKYIIKKSGSFEQTFHLDYETMMIQLKRKHKKITMLIF